MEQFRPRQYSNSRRPGCGILRHPVKQRILPTSIPTDKPQTKSNHTLSSLGQPPINCGAPDRRDFSNPRLADLLNTYIWAR